MIRRSLFGQRALEGLPLKPFATGIWIADGDSVSVAGFRYPTRMAVIRLADWGALRLVAGGAFGCLRAAVEALGLAARRGDLRFDGELGEAPEAGWRGVPVRPG